MFQKKKRGIELKSMPQKYDSESSEDYGMERPLISYRSNELSSRHKKSGKTLTGWLPKFLKGGSNLNVEVVEVEETEKKSLPHLSRSTAKWAKEKSKKESIVEKTTEQKEKKENLKKKKKKKEEQKKENPKKEQKDEQKKEEQKKEKHKKKDQKKQKTNKELKKNKKLTTKPPQKIFRLRRQPNINSRPIIIKASRKRPPPPIIVIREANKKNVYRRGYPIDIRSYRQK